MSETQQPEPRYDVTYETVPQFRNAPMLVRLAGIFNLVAGSVDILYAAGMGVILTVMAIQLTSLPPPAPAAGPAAGPGLPPKQMILMMSLMHGIPGFLSLIASIFKMIAGIKFLRHGKRAWGWGLAAAIIGSMELWMFIGCCFAVVFPVGAGVYTLIILCFPHVQQYLAAPVQSDQVLAAPTEGA